jgi:hypothetical protein
MADDHDLTYSVASLAVQIFTVPSLAVYLIENDDVIFTILNSFYELCISLCGLRKYTWLYFASISQFMHLQVARELNLTSATRWS